MIYRPIKEGATVYSGYAFKKTDLNSNGDIPIIKIGNLVGNIVDYSKTDFISSTLVKDKYNKYFLENKDVLIAMTGQGSVGRVAQLRKKRNDTLLLNQRVGKFVCNSLLDNDYLFYVLSSKYYQEILFNLGYGSGQPNLNPETILNVSIPFPDIKTQKRIAKLLATFDDKIALNTAISENLEQQAQAIYSEMFLDKRSEKWQSGTLSDIAIITMGQSPKGDTFNEIGNGAVFYQGRTDFGFRFPTRRLYTTEPKRMTRRGDTLMSVRAPVGDLNVAYEECCIGRGLAAIHSKDNHQSYVLYTLFTLKKQLDVFNGEGTVFGSINKDSLNSMEIVIPPIDIIDKFESIANPIDRAIYKNYGEICRLQAIRDTLLPKLMNGEIDISEVKI